MPKAKSALFTGISGSLRKSVTFRDTTQTPDITLQTRPVPTDRRTAKQAAVRDAYARLAWLWKNLPALDKAPYEAMAEARNLTPWNCWLSFHLPLMRLTPQFYTAFVEGSGTTIQDFAIGGLTGTANGPAWTEKNLFPAPSFDGIDDVITFSRPGYYDTVQNFSIYLLIQKNEIKSPAEILIGTKSYSSNTRGFALAIYPGGRLELMWANGTNPYSIPSTERLTLPSISTVGIIKNGSNVTFYINGVSDPKTIAPNNVAPSNENFTIGRGPAGSYPCKSTPYIASIFHSPVTVATFAALDAHYRPFFT